MESLSKADEPFPTSQPYFLPDESQSVRAPRIYHINSPFSPPPPPCFSFSPGIGCSTETYPSLTASPVPIFTPKLKFVSHETELCCSPGLTTCTSCQTRVTTQVIFKVGRHAWLMCLVFVLCSLVLGCCLIPFFVNHFKDAYHTCPRCYRVLHVHRRSCCE
ncbi:hypothetical protein OYC64_016623 [Pagothenia borchgrevinki]|uniref:LITAF domain-containing protein n=1 Tax=Pagothenia borchgrevinki TaxID=8213 RepID=A0ABD2HLG5_PAGBO